MITKKSFTYNRLQQAVHTWCKHSFKGKYTLALFLMVISCTLSAQSNKSKPLNAGRVIKGIVTDMNDETIIGASIALKNTTVGSISDVNGIYTLNVPTQNSTIVISYIGYVTQEIKIDSKEYYRVKLAEDNKTIDEVVVVGYGSQNKATITGSVAVVRGDDVKKSPEANITNTLVGRMPGLIANNRSGEPGNDFSEILIRGKCTIGNSQPLFVIDGIANRFGGIDRLNSSDIESITVLKDASAAIYGAQAANGVILVTTKRGISSKPVITYEGSYGLSENTRTPKLMDAVQFMTYEDEMNAIDHPDDITQQKFRGIKDKYVNGVYPNPNKYGNTEWMGVVFQKLAPKTQHSISVRGGNESVKYYVSGAFLYQEPCYKNTNFNFNTNQLRASIDANITKNLTVNLDLSTREENRNESNYATDKIFWEAFNAYPYLNDYYPSNNLPASGISWGNNVAILASGGTGYYKVKDYFVNSKVGFDLKLPSITKGLFINGYLARDKQFRNDEKLMGQWDAYNYDEITDTYSNIRATTGDGNINLTQRNDSRSLNTAMIRLGYERKFQYNSVSAFVAYEQSSDNTDWFSGYRRDLPSVENAILNKGGEVDKTNAGSSSFSKRQNIFGRCSYAYKDKYLAEATLRRDGSVNFDKGKRWGWFPGLSLGWRVSEESFMKNFDFINELKIKASVGQLGNDRVPSFQYFNVYNMSQGGRFGVDTKQTKGYTIGQWNAKKDRYINAANPNITWEKSTNYNVGFESQFMQGMFAFDAQYFHSYRTDILTPRIASIPLYAGILAPDENIGIISNQGFELELTHRHKIGEFTYAVGGNFTFARNKIVNIDEETGIPDWQKRTGYSIDSYLVYKTDGLFQNELDVIKSPRPTGESKPGDIKYVNNPAIKDNVITQADMVRIHQSPTPEIVYGFTLNGGYNGFELTMLLQGQARATTLIQPYTYNRDVDYYNNRWISAEATPNAKYPRAFDKNDPINSLPSDFWLNDASFLRLKNLEVAYNFKGDWLKRMNVKSVRISLSGSNLLTLSKIKILDPETTEQGGLYYPQQRIYNIGLSVTL